MALNGVPCAHLHTRVRRACNNMSRASVLANGVGYELLSQGQTESYMNTSFLFTIAEHSLLLVVPARLAAKAEQYAFTAHSVTARQSGVPSHSETCALHLHSGDD
ncbi:hypothetical protein TRVL_02421 [Trypanosoma vivax]|nr:hypothetical protein TRVL_02421 [Trypanosoma vivax]